MYKKTPPLRPSPHLLLGLHIITCPPPPLGFPDPQTLTRLGLCSPLSVTRFPMSSTLGSLGSRPKTPSQRIIDQLWCALVVECVDVHYLLSDREFIAYLHFFPSYVSRAQLQVFKTHIDAFTCAETLYDCFASLATIVSTIFVSIQTTARKLGQYCMVNEDESVQEIATVVEKALANWAKFYESDRTPNTWNRGQIRAGGLCPEYLPLTPEVCLSYTRASPSTLVHAPQIEADVAAADAALTEALRKQVDIRRAVTRRVKRKNARIPRRNPSRVTSSPTGTSLSLRHKRCP